MRKIPKRKDIPLRYLKPEEILSAEEMEERYRSRPECPFPPPWETAGDPLTNSCLRARYRISHHFGLPLLQQHLLCRVPEIGLCVLWRIWGKQIEVVRATEQDGSICLSTGVIRVSENNAQKVQWIIDRYMTVLPPWVRSRQEEKEETL